jgi:hypothetical protein
MKQELAKFK